MSGHDSKYFSTTKKGEIPELKEELNSQYKDKRKDAVKKVIAAMTVGKDVSSLFTDVVNCMQTENLELKKLVYLYLINYAKSQPDLAILAVNTFVKDSQDPNPLIRALAVRTMGCIRVDKITEYLCDPLQRCLKDDDPYVRKTAAICVAKLYDLNAEQVDDRGFLDALKDLISDNNPMVVANAVAALAEIQETSARPIFDITSATLAKLLTALNGCTECGQVYMLDALSRYKAADAREAENVVERVTPCLQLANCAMVLSAVKMILLQMELITSIDVVRNLCKKMAPPLVTLLTAEPEIQYVALRNISLIVQKRPTILAHEIKAPESQSLDELIRSIGVVSLCLDDLVDYKVNILSQPPQPYLDKSGGESNQSVGNEEGSDDDDVSSSDDDDSDEEDYREEREYANNDGDDYYESDLGTELEQRMMFGVEDPIYDDKGNETGDSTREGLATATLVKGDFMPIQREKPNMELVKVTYDMKPFNVYAKLLLEQTNERHYGAGLKKAVGAEKEDKK